MTGSDRLILATDPDREGEAISWHVLEVLNKKKALKDAAVERGGVQRHHQDRRHRGDEATRATIDMELVDAYLARRALDYLVGFTLSPVLWRKLPGARSAGRVQSVALRLVVDREVEIEALPAPRSTGPSRPTSRPAAEPFPARLVKLDRKRLSKFDLPDEASAKAALKAVQVGRPARSPRWRRSRPGAARRRRSPPRPCSRRPRASSASRPSAPCRPHSGSTRASDEQRRPDHLHADRRGAVEP